VSTLVEGEVRTVRHADGRVEITQAPPRARMALSLLASADPVVVRATGDTITLAGQVVYRVSGWDTLGRCLLLDLVEDRREEARRGG
jgi:hypothetical protein